jgi:translation elongation factor EF-G
MSDMTREEIRERLGNIDQIRDIIFGAQLRDYDNRLSKVESDMALLQQEMRDRLDHLRASLSGEVKAAVDGLDKKLKSYNLTTQEECADLRQQVDRINRKFSSGIQTLDETVDAQTAALRNELSGVKSQIQEDVTALRDLVLEELDRRFSHLGDTKASKDDIAETLFELGMRLKGTEFIPKLRETADNNVGYDPLPLMVTRKLSKEFSSAD